MTALYNEFDPVAAAWLRELIRRGLIAPGIVDERSILEIAPSDLEGFTQVHFFAGIGGWSYALRLSGWPDEKPVWTGSPPCQPFSNAGQKKGQGDERHLGPHFAYLVGACQPELLFGEQVASAQVLGRVAKPTKRNAIEAPEWAWFDDLSDRLEAAQYAVAAADIPAAGIGAPHIRQRTCFGAIRLAHSERFGHAAIQREGDRGMVGGEDDERSRTRLESGCSNHRTSPTNGFWSDADWIGCRDGKWRPVEPGTQPLAYGVPARVGRLRGYGNAIVPQAAAEFIKAFVDAVK